MLTAYHVSLPHACCPLVARRIRAQRDYYEALRAPVHICVWSHELFFICYHRFGSGSVGIREHDQVWDTTVPLESVTFRHRRAEVTFFTTSHAFPIQHNSITAYLLSSLTELYVSLMDSEL